MYGKELIDPTLQDPYSDVSLFLSKKIKEQAISTDHSKEWSHYLQEKLLEKITPEFGKKFPQYRLGAAAVKRTWEKVFHFSKLFEGRSDALTAEGKLNLHFLIRENLKTVLFNGSLHPFLLAQQLALKIGESLAAYEGVRPHLEQLTELIWTALHHLIPFPSHIKKKLDSRDRLIAKWLVDAVTQQPGLSYQELSQTLQRKLKLFQSLKVDLTESIHKLYADWATILLPHTTLYQTQSSASIRELRSWIHQHRDLDIQDLKTAALSSKLNISLHDLEILVWSSLKDTRPATPIYEELAKEAKIHLIHHPQEHWKTAIAQATHFLKSAHEISNLGTKSDWNHRIEVWSIQGELALRSLQLPETPLLHLVRETHLKNRSLSDPSITTQLREQYLYRYPSPLIEPSQVHPIADLMRKYGWYHFVSSPSDVTIELWTCLHNRTHSHSEFPLLPNY